MGKSKEALEYYKLAEKIMVEMGNRLGEGLTLGNEGLVLLSLGEYSEGLKQLQKSHQVFCEIGFKKGQAITLGNIGVIYHKLGMYEEALKGYQKNLLLRKEIHDRGGEGFDLVNQGVSYQHLGKFEKAIEYFKAAEIVAKEVGSTYLLCESLNGFGIVFRKLGEKNPKYLEEAMKKVQEALKVSKKNNLDSGKVKTLSNLGRIFLLKDKKKEALQKSIEAIELVKIQGSDVEGSWEDAYFNHYHILNALGQKEESMKWLGKLVRLIQERSEKIKEKEYKKSFLEKVRLNRFVLNEWPKKIS